MIKNVNLFFYQKQANNNRFIKIDFDKSLEIKIWFAETIKIEK